MATKDPEQLTQECRAVRTRNAYLEHQVAYLESLLRVLGGEDGRSVEKRCMSAIEEAIDLRRGARNVRLLCAIAEVSRKSYYAYLERKREGHAEEEQLVAFIWAIQEETYHGVGYRQMTALIRSELGLQVNAKQVRSLMAANNLLSAVRRKKYSPEVHMRKKEMRHIPPNLLKGRYFSCTPRSIFVADITYLHCLEQVLFLNSILDLYNQEVVAWLISEHAEHCVVCGDLTGSCGD